MFKTGNISIDSFSQLVILLPVLPALIIFVRGIYRKEVLNFLMILCLLSLLEGLTLLFDSYTTKSKLALHLVFSYLQLIVFIQIFKTVLSLHSKYILYMVTLLYIAIVTTYVFSVSPFQYHIASDLASNTLIGIVSIISLGNAIKIYNLQIFNSPVFWIAVGTLFYLAIAIIVQINLICCNTLYGTASPDSMVLLDVANTIRFACYSLAAICYLPQHENHSV